jgi:predicted nucleic acid-binding protein
MALSSLNKPKIALDSNVFRNLQFINYLVKHRDEISIALPSLVQLEIGYFYLSKGFTMNDFFKYIQRFNAKLMDWNSLQIEEILRNAIVQKEFLPFKDHFRDFIIGTQCEALSYSLITNNINHFRWLKQVTTFTPDAFIIFFERNYAQSKSRNNI